jgi:hypothetical protein
MVPAHLMVRDRWDAEMAADKLILPSLWVSKEGPKERNAPPAGYSRITAGKTLFWLDSSPGQKQAKADMLARWLDDLPARSAGR